MPRDTVIMRSLFEEAPNAGAQPGQLSGGLSRQADAEIYELLNNAHLFADCLIYCACFA